MRIKGIVSYDGHMYYGFQVQKDIKQKSIQGEIQNVLSKFFNCEIKIAGSGRTDKGVHALNQVFHFDIDREEVDLDRLKYSINKMLPNDILIKSFEIVDDSFHSRFSATKKHYRYRILLKDNPFEINYAYINHKDLDIDLIKQGMGLFLGNHCFVNFCANKEEDNDYNKTIFDFTLTQNEDELVFDIYGNGFKRFMVRMIMGTLIALGEHQIDLSYINERLTLPMGNNTSYKAEPQGLYLMEVYYD